ncbi:MAG: Rieske 2Fe-2S domain-containing protein [Burkholderiaceae bacterium]
MPDAAPLALCRTDALAERGDAHVFDVLHRGEPATAFVLRHDGRLVAYLNRCVHIQAEMDWQPGRFLDSDRAFILCSIHGASYEPHSGRCAGGPCGRGSLTPIAVTEIAGRVHWYPSRDTLPLPAGPAPAAESSP